MLFQVKKKREREAKELQRQLDSQHSKRDYVNSVNNTNYTTKRALEEYYKQ